MIDKRAVFIGWLFFDTLKLLLVLSMTIISFLGIVTNENFIKFSFTLGNIPTFYLVGFLAGSLSENKPWLNGILASILGLWTTALIALTPDLGSFVAIREWLELTPNFILIGAIGGLLGGQVSLPDSVQNIKNSNVLIGTLFFVGIIINFVFSFN